MNITNPISRRRRRGLFSLTHPLISQPPAPSDTYSITGTITGPKISGVIVYALDSTTRQVVRSGISDLSGNYTISNLPKDVSYDLLPMVDSHIFTPHLYQVTLSSDIDLDFLSVAGGQYLYDSTTVSLVDSSNNRLWESVVTNLGFPYTFPITLI